MTSKIKPQGFRSRTPIAKIDTLPDFSIESFLSSLTNLSIQELAARYVEINSQSQMMKGLILLQARERLPSNIEFGNWVKSISALCADGHQTLNRYMNFASYFKDKDREGISLTACYEISAPINADIADNLYQIALNQNLSVAQIKAEIVKAKGLLPESVKGSGEPELMPLGDISSFTERVLAEIGELPKNDALRVLDECRKAIKKEK
ncbi:MAG: hypothetical protein WCL34_13905 [Methylococcaceae bacterium]